MNKLAPYHKTFIESLKKGGKATATVVAYSKDVEQLLSHFEELGKTHPREVKKEDIESFLEKLKNTNYTIKSVSRKINATRTFFSYLYMSKHIIENPASQISHPKFDVKKPRILTKMEYRALRDAAKDDKRAFAMVEVLLQTGLRISELANIRVEDVSFGGDGKVGSLRVPQVETKIGRIVPLNPAVQRAVKAYIEIRPKSKKDYLFVTKTGNAVLIRNIRSTIDRLFKLAGVENARVNDLRHAFVIYHLRMGVNISHLSKIAGHKRLSTTEKYLEFVEGKPENSQSLELGEL